MKIKFIVVTGGCGFIGSSLIKKLLELKNIRIISIDNYSAGTYKNEIKSKNVRYIKSDTSQIKNILEKYKKKIDVVFHFGEFSRIHQSFIDLEKCFKSNILGTSAVINFCFKNKIRLIYSATSASLGNEGKDKSLSPYALTKANNLQLIQHLNKWFSFNFECLYFYNVYGPKQIKKGPMATVIGIFERQFEKNEYLTVAKPGNQTRKFTHIDDTVNGCIYAYKKKKNRHYSLSNNKSYSILTVAKMFSRKIKFIKKKSGERKKSINLRKIKNIKIYQYSCKINLKNYIDVFKKKLIT